MSFQQPTPTPLDLRFRLFGTSVCVRPTFWLVGGLLGYFIARGRLDSILIYIACFLAAILVHEMGHAIIARRFSERLHIVLSGFGGMAAGMSDRLNGRQRILIAVAGPTAGFLFYWLASEGEVWWNRYLEAHRQDIAPIVQARVREALGYLLFMNLFWNAMNLLPIYPLDGGQVVHEVCLGASPSRGAQISFGLSFLGAAGVAGYSALKMQRPELWYPDLSPLFVLIIFGYMAVQNLIMLTSARPEPRRQPQPEEAW